MTTFFYTHPDCLAHETGPKHPESIARLQELLERLKDPEFSKLKMRQGPHATLDQIQAVHPVEYINTISKNAPASGFKEYDHSGTVISSGTYNAVFGAAGAVCAAVDDVMSRTATNVFCGVRPPGHHAKATDALSFCFLNNIAIGVRHLQKNYSLKRIAVIDFDVHHGNGTQELLEKDENVFFASMHQAFIFPKTGKTGVSESGNVVNVQVVPSLSGKKIVETFTAKIIPPLAAFKPEFIFISAGFDAHRNDPIGGLKLDYDDFATMTRELMGVAEKYCDRRIVSALEGGYDARSLANAAAVHILELMKA